MEEYWGGVGVSRQRLPYKISASWIRNDFSRTTGKDTRQEVFHGRW